MSDTPHDPMQDPTVLASAYLDGEVTAAERAQVDADPALLAEVERLRGVRGLVVADVEPAPVSVRESQLAAALDVFDQLSAATPAAAPTPIGTARVRRERRRSGGGERMRAVLGVAAGLVVVAGAGAVIRSVVVGGGDDDSADLASVDEPAEEELAIGPDEAEIVAEGRGENTNDEPPLDVDPTEVASDVLTDTPAQAPADVPADEPADDRDWRTARH